MKQLLLIPLFYFVYLSQSIAQSDAFTFTTTPTGLDADQNKVLSYVNGLPRTGNLKYLNWNTLGLLDSNGNISITLPNENNGQTITFEVTGAFYANDVEYALTGQSTLGEISLYITPQGTGGVIDLNTKAYKLFPLGSNKGLLIEQPQNETEGVICGTAAGPDLDKSLSYCDFDCGTAELDILAMVTPAARIWLDTSYGTYGAWFLFVETNNINIAFLKSGVPNKRVRVKTIDYTPNFSLTGNFGTDLDYFKVNQVAQQLAQSYGADIRVLLTNINYATSAGAYGAMPSDQEDPTATNKIAILDIPFIGSIRYTFAHEVAHHFACWHSNPLKSGCRNGKNMASGRNTIMANAGNNTRIQHFSNPAILFAGDSTGIVGTRDNAAQIRGAFCEVANNNSPAFFSLTLTKDVACVNQPFSAYAYPSAGWNIASAGFEQWCSGPFTYQWSWSLYPNFSNAQVVGGNNPWLDLSQPPACPKFYLRIRITNSTGCTLTRTELVSCQSGVACDRSIIDSNVNLSKFVQIIPNPANDYIKVNLGINNPGIKSINAVRADGMKSIITKFTQSSDGELLCDVSNLGTGLWFLHIEGTQINQAFKFVIVR